MFDSRKANKRVEIYETEVTADGYGGNIVETPLTSIVAKRWCIIKSLSANSYQDVAGITDFTNAYQFTFRYDKQLTIDPKKHILKYQNKEYEILSVSTDGFKHVSQIVIAKEIFALE